MSILPFLRLCARRQGGALEATAVFRWWRPERPQEASAHGLSHAESAFGGDLIESFIRILESPSGSLDAQSFDVASRRDADLMAPGSGEVAGAHDRPSGKRLHPQVAGKIVGQPHLHLP